MTQKNAEGCELGRYRWNERERPLPALCIRSNRRTVHETNVNVPYLRSASVATGAGCAKRT